MECNECGTPVSNSIEYCPNCGTYQNQPNDPSKLRVLPGINTSGEVTSKLSLAIFVIPILVLLVMVSGLITAVPSDDENRESDSIETPTPTETPPTENEANTPTETTPTPEPTLTPTEEPSPTPRPDDDYDYIEILKTNLEQEDITTEAYEIVDNGPEDSKVLIFGFRSSGGSEEQIKNEIETITNEVLYVIEQGWDVDNSLILIGDSSGNAVGQVHIKKEWVEDYLDGEISKDELVDRVLGTVTSYG
jgi:hypothetical protein